MSEPSDSLVRQAIETLKDLRVLTWAVVILILAISTLPILPFFVFTFLLGAFFILLFFGLFLAQSKTSEFQGIGIFLSDEERVELTKSVEYLDKGVHESQATLLEEVKKAIEASRKAETLPTPVKSDIRNLEETIVAVITDQFQSLKEKVGSAKQVVHEVVYDDNSPELDSLKYGDGPFPGSRGGVASFTDTVLLKVIAQDNKAKTLDEIKQGFAKYEALFPYGVDVEKLVHESVGCGYVEETSTEGLMRYTVTFNGWKISQWQ